MGADGAAGGGPSTRAIARIFLTVAGLAAFLYLLYQVRSVLGLILIAVFVAVALGPPVDFFNRRLNRASSILVAFLLVFAIFTGIGLLIVPPIVNQINDFANQLPSYIQDARDNETIREYDQRYGITDKLLRQAETLPSRLGDAASTLQAVTVGVFSTVVQLITILTLAFFMLLDGKRITEGFFRLLGRRTEEDARLVSGSVYKAVAGYVAGAAAIALLAGLMAYVTLSLLGVPFAVPLAILQAFLGLIPLVGATIAGIAIAIVTVFEDFPTATIIWVVVFVVYQQIENNVLSPMIYRRTVNVHPLLVIVSILMGSSLLGVLGALLAIPIAATLQIIVLAAWERRRKKPVEALILAEDTDPDTPPARAPLAGDPEIILPSTAHRPPAGGAD